MGQHMTKSDKMMVIMLRRQLAKAGFQVAEDDMVTFIKFLKEVSPWFMEEGTLSLDEWKRVGKEMRHYVREKGEKTLPSEISPFEGLCRDTASETGVTSPIYSEVGKEEGNEEEKRPLKPSAPPFASSHQPLTGNDLDGDWGLDDQQEETEWEDDFRDHTDPPVRAAIGNITKGKPVPKPRSRPLPPVGFQGALAEARKTGDTSLGIFPVTEIGDNDEPIWEPMPLKTLKELQSAVKSLGPSAPYTLQVLDMVASLWLTPHDWMQTAKATLSPGDYILWRTEYEDKCKDSIVQSIKKRGPKPTMSMLMGTDDYALPQDQVKIPRDILTIITGNAVLAWRKLPPPGTKGGALASIRQKNEESYQDFISRLEEAVTRMLPPSEGTDMLLKQLAWENANALCQDLIRPLRQTGTLNDFIKACMDASPAVVQGMAYAAAMKGQRFSAYVKKTYGGGAKGITTPTCYNCGKPGHIQRDCKKSKSSGRKSLPGICPRCKKGKHWSNECNSKYHKDGSPLTKEGEEEPKESKN
ncbi:endogenous retrovirus group K member 8 Gag polyprotein [Alexandromys fortis]|uniref:endogenous retrovirus group K member 8 Gag polyprotein n=1 Tax=Alexandromys fortis TaxID=100897 RepID=UPI0021535545|nr:endogenous retrovirus group K member 8 Gag polyprotein [Microtus fortis]